MATRGHHLQAEIPPVQSVKLRVNLMNGGGKMAVSFDWGKA
jgi:hypothetical protein